MSSQAQGAISSLVLFTSVVSTATFHPLSRPRSRSSSSASSSTSAPPSPVSVPTGSPLKRIRRFCSKKKTSSRYVNPPTTVNEDDDMSTALSGAQMYLNGRHTLSVPDLPNWNNVSMSTSESTFHHTSLDETLEEEDEDWDKMIDGESPDSGPQKNSSMPGKRRPSLPALPALPFSLSSFSKGKGEKKHNRCKSLPQIPVHDLPNSLYQKSKSSSENWDDYYDIETPEIHVPKSVEDSQIFIRMDMFNILDFNSHIKELETLRQRKRSLTESIRSTSRYYAANTFLPYGSTEMCYDALETKYNAYWEEADVILDLNDVAQDQTPVISVDRSIHVGIERTPSERHFHVLKDIIKDELGDNASKVIQQSKVQKDAMKTMVDEDDSDKENRAFGGKSEAKKRKERLRISAEMVPRLIERLKKLRELLTEHIEELTLLVEAKNDGVEHMSTEDGNLITS